MNEKAILYFIGAILSLMGVLSKLKYEKNEKTNILAQPSKFPLRLRKILLLFNLWGWLFLSLSIVAFILGYIVYNKDLVKQDELDKIRKTKDSIQAAFMGVITSLEAQQNYKLDSLGIKLNLTHKDVLEINSEVEKKGNTLQSLVELDNDKIKYQTKDNELIIELPISNSGNVIANNINLNAYIILTKDNRVLYTAVVGKLKNISIPPRSTVRIGGSNEKWILPEHYKLHMCVMGTYEDSYSKKVKNILELVAYNRIRDKWYLVLIEEGNTYVSYLKNYYK
ncbi:MAG: hypothetical protein R2800_06480 [Flavipsychrobacter sp.]